jgi:enediyne biosynthesis protein E4
MAPRAAALLGAVMSCSLLSSPAQSQTGVPQSAAADATLSVPRFAEETAASGLVHRYLGEREFMVGGGVASLDCDGNGLTDLYLAGGAAPARLLRNTGTAGGALAFAAETSPEATLVGVTGVYALNIDGDDHSDLVVLRQGENLLLRGLGDCRFERANEAWGFDGGAAWTTAFSATWEEGQSWPTLAIGNYIDMTQPGAPAGTCHANQLYRPRPGGGFAAPLALEPGFCALSMLFTDWNGDGLADLRISNDREYYRGGEEQLWHVPPGGAPRPYGREEGWAQLQIWGMGIASHDVTGDGLPDYFLTSMADNKLRSLQSGTGTPAYSDIAYARGVTAHRPYRGDQSKPSTAWHAEFQDINNDSFVDLFVVKGNVEAMEAFALDDPNNLLLGRPDGSFVEAGAEAGLDSGLRGRGGAVVDLNGDALLDVVVVNRKDPAQVWRNLGSVEGKPLLGNWLQVRLRGDEGGNRDGVGAWIEVSSPQAPSGELRLQRREVFVGGGHAGGSVGWLNFGLGSAQDARLRVRWPHGDWGGWIPVSANTFVELTAAAAAR